jgi:hypothetical protein
MNLRCYPDYVALQPIEEVACEAESANIPTWIDRCRPQSGHSERMSRATIAEAAVPQGSWPEASRQ